MSGPVTGRTSAGAQASVGPASVVVVGTGLIGTSIALALAERGVRVWLADSDPAAVRLAADLGAGQPLPGDSMPAGSVPGGPADVAVLAVPPGRGRAGAAVRAAPQARALLYRRGQRQGTSAGGCP